MSCDYVSCDYVSCDCVSVARVFTCVCTLCIPAWVVSVRMKMCDARVPLRPQTHLPFAVVRGFGRRRTQHPLAATHAARLPGSVYGVCMHVCMYVCICIVYVHVHGALGVWCMCVAYAWCAWCMVYGMYVHGVWAWVHVHGGCMVHGVCAWVHAMYVHGSACASGLAKSAFVFCPFVILCSFGQQVNIHEGNGRRAYLLAQYQSTVLQQLRNIKHASLNNGFHCTR